jgi:predicted nucleotidyltransferase component of viral defense system
LLKLPIANQLKKRSQIEIAYLQDEIVDIMYSISDDLVLHGGTAIWRCYSGKRFSEGLDFYSKSFPKLLDSFEKTVRSHGLALQKIKDAGNIIFSNVRSGIASVKVEVNHVSNMEGTQMLYQLADGSSMEILSLTQDQFIEEMILAYRNRRFIRDLYDIFHLVNSTSLLASTQKNLYEFMKSIEPTIDEQVLKTIVYQGLPPSLDSLKRTIMRGIQ